MVYGLIYHKRKHWLLTLFKSKGIKLATYPFPVLNRDGSLWQCMFLDGADGRIYELHKKQPNRKYEVIALQDIRVE